MGLEVTKGVTSGDGLIGKSSREEKNSKSQVQLEQLFVRREEKFFLPLSMKNDFMDLVAQHLPPSYPDKSTKYTLIESQYFDSSDLRSFRDHFENVKERFKLRTRRYGPNGQWQKGNAIFLELKLKCNQISNKLRLKLDPTDLLRLLSGQSLKKTEKKTKTSEKINTVIKDNHVTPICRVTYRRFAFEREGLRVTIDDKIEAQFVKNFERRSKKELMQTDWWMDAERMSMSFSNMESALVEVKHSGVVPHWLQLFMSENGLQFTSFSKYCYSIANQLQK